MWVPTGTSVRTIRQHVPWVCSDRLVRAFAGSSADVPLTDGKPGSCVVERTMTTISQSGSTHAHV